jgi:GNAT superfamily N-acetyltransferase
MHEYDSGKLRMMRPEDVPAAFELSAEAGWNQTEEDWRMLLDLAPEGCLAIEADGQVAATTTLVCYERRLAWIGMVLTKREYRRRGWARTLLAKTLAQADQMGIETTKLDATEQGLPLYEEFGFHAEHEVERWSRPGGQVTQFPAVLRTCSEEAWRESDVLAFGADRSRLLEMLAQRNHPKVLSRSYLFARPGRVTAHLGPCVGENPEAVRHLIEQCLHNTTCGWTWDLFPSNQEAVDLARDLGFTPQRHLVRMVRGKALRQNEKAMYAIAGFELG